MTADLQNPIFHDETKAREALEAVRWPDGPVCPHCGNADQDRIAKVEGTKRSHRPGLYYCNECKGQFTVTVGTVFERSKVPLTKWWLAAHLMSASKKGISAHQLHRMLGVTYKTAWFMAHRIREAMREDGTFGGPLGGEGKTVEADETYIGKRDKPYVSPHRRGLPYTKSGKSGGAQKRTVVALVERGGRVRSFHVQHATKKSVREILVRNVDRKSVLYTDESRLYTETGKEYEGHDTVNHSAKEYVRGMIHTNTIENVFSVFKRGMRGVYQHCGEAHLFRYLAEFDFRYNRRSGLGYSDAERVAEIMQNAAGKRLTYRRTCEAQIA
ncbi:ISXO2-like transposase domain protein [Methyloligella halotolerans]|uniref:ISXO2-like transposase domain protein n=1 Tax=Methyloligella halotolerans TaxID=1177755 RepID=A0A1E2RXL9_9HYPH|nr:IS1595 family transposase [Methyloligella halotolerans]ODA66855.1 ISXO2-like transposase domain protein [Methyloligella halotolerans]